MNSLSWMFYLAGVVENLGNLLAVGSVISGLCSVFVCMYALIEAEPKAFRWLRLTLPTCALFAILAVFTPNKDTLYAIAASEVGEEVLKSPETTKARAALNAWLDKQIGDEKPEKQQ